MAAKEKTNLLEVIPCRSEHITAEWEGEHNSLPFPFCCYMFTATGNNL